MRCGCDTSYLVSVHIQCQASIYTLSLCSKHSWRVRIAKQEMLTPPGHLVSPLVCRGPWMSTVVLYCWCHSHSASVLLYFTLLLRSSTFHKYNVHHVLNLHYGCTFIFIHCSIEHRQHQKCLHTRNFQWQRSKWTRTYISRAQRV